MHETERIVAVLIVAAIGSLLVVALMLDSAGLALVGFGLLVGLRWWAGRQ